LITLLLRLLFHFRLSLETFQFTLFLAKFRFIVAACSQAYRHGLYA